MRKKGKLAYQRIVYRQMLKLPPASLKLISCLASMTILCTYTVAQENTTDYWMDRAESLTHNGSIDEAISAYDEALKIEPENTTILICKASDLNVEGRANESQDTYLKALGILDQELNDNPGNAEAWQAKAGILRSLNRQNESTHAYEKALEAYSSAIEKSPEDTDAWLRKAKVLQILGRWDEARATYDNATTLSPEDYEAWWEMGQFLSSTGDINESIKAYDQAIELIPANDTANLALAWADKTEELASAGRWEDALQSANKTLELNPKDRPMWHFKAFIQTNLGRKDDALATFDEALKQNPGDTLNWQYKASLLVELMRYNESLEAYDRTLELISENDTAELAQTWLGKGMALNKSGKEEAAQEALEKALELYEQAISSSPDDMGLLQSKGWTLYELGRYNEALAVYDEILETAPSIEPYLTQTSAWIARGDALHALGRNKEALEAYNNAIETGPNFDTAWQGKSEAQKAMGQAYNASMSLYVAEKLGYEE